MSPKYDFLYHVGTSGTSTGTKKIISVPIEAIWLNIKDFSACFKLSEKDVIFSAAPPTFDPFYLDLFVAFLAQATLFLTSRKMKMRSGLPLSNLLHGRKVTFSQMTPTLFKNLVKCPKSLQQLVLGGELFPSGKTLRPILSDCSKTPKLFNVYGLTEMSVWQSLIEIKNLSLDEQPIYSDEKLLSDPKLYLDQEGQICLETRNRACYFNDQLVRLIVLLFSVLL